MRTETIIRAYLNTEGRLGPYIRSTAKGPKERGARLARQYDTFRAEMYRRARDYDRRRGVKFREDHLADARERMRWIFRSWWTQAPEAAEAAISWEAAGFPWRASIMRGYAELWGRK